MLDSGNDRRGLLFRSAGDDDFQVRPGAHRSSAGYRSRRDALATPSDRDRRCRLGGVWAALGAAAGRQLFATQHAIDITLVAPGEYLLIRPRLYERDLRGARVPLYGILPQVRVRHIDATVERIDTTEHKLELLGIGVLHELHYDQLIICAGSRRAIRLEAARQHGVDNYEEALALHAVLDASRSERPSVAAVGSNFAGLEVATELAAEAEVHLIEQRDHVAPATR